VAQSSGVHLTKAHRWVVLAFVYAMQPRWSSCFVPDVVDKLHLILDCLHANQCLQSTQ